MSFLLIKGIFNPKNGMPDGDSVRFLAEDDTLFEQIEGDVKFKTGGEVQLRYEGVDAMEKAAKKPFSSKATEANIEMLGGERNELPGYILSSHTDKNGRPVCFVFAGAPNEPDGTEIFLREDLLKQSVNYQLLAEGFLYPMFYETLYKELRDVMIEAVQSARQQGKGIWANDVSNEGLIITPPVKLNELEPIFRKLWRRLENFYQRQSNKNKPVQDFIADLARTRSLIYHPRPKGN